MKILSTEQIRELDAYTIENEPITSIDLMERASKSFVKEFQKYFSNQEEVYIFCGLGNNGGDGLAVARLLLALNYQVKTFVIRFSENSSPDFQVNFERLQKISSIIKIKEENQIPEIPSNVIVIDAIFGSGLSRGVEGLLVAVIQKINQSKVKIISIDIASGLFADKESKRKNIIQPDLTITFQVPKLAFLLPQNAKYVRDWKITDIGLNQKKLNEFECNYYYINKFFAKNLLKQREKFSHKGTHGKALLVVGSYGKIGAGVLAAKACLRSGVGLLTCYVPKVAYHIMQTAVPEAMVLTDKAINFLQTHPAETGNYDSVGVGCGIDQKTITIQFIENLLENTKKPIVIDADAINLIGKNQEILEKIPENSIFTPHPKEFERLVGKTENDFQNLEKMLEFCKKYKVVMLLKGAHTAITSPEGKIYFNSTGNAGMATAGSGDVLTGIITGLLAQGYSSLNAAILGVYLHGLAGDFTKESQSEESLIASDIIENLGKAFKNLKK